MQGPIVPFLAYPRRDGVNRPRIAALMKAKGITCAKAAKACGKSCAAIKNMLAGFSAFTIGDIQCFYKLLKLNGAEATEIFFGKPV